MSGEAGETAEQTPAPQKAVPNQHEEPRTYYFKIYGRLKAEHRRSMNNSEFFLRSYSVIGNSSEVGWFLLLALILPITLIIVGSLNFDNCPVEDKIPLWMIVGGVGSVISQCLNAVRNIYINNHTKVVTVEDELGRTSAMTLTSDSGIFAGYCNAALTLFNITWFIIGNIWVFGVYNDVEYDEEDSSDYCDGLCYRLAFWSIIAVYIVVAVSFLVICFILILIGFEEVAHGSHCHLHNHNQPAGPVVTQEVVYIQQI